MPTKLSKVEAVVKKCVPEITALPSFPHDHDSAKAVVAIEKILALKHINQDMVQTAALAVKAYEDDRVSAYIRELEGKYAGRPIGLADVLYTISHMSGGHFAVNVGGCFMRMRSCTPAYGHYDFTMVGMQIVDRMVPKEVTDVRWNFHQPLHGQSPETISFLHSILCKGDLTDNK